MTSYFTANRSGEALVIADTPPPNMLSTLDIAVQRLLPPQQENDDWTVDPGADLRFIATPSGSRAGIPTGLNLRPGDVIRVNYQVPAPSGTWASVPSATFSFRASEQTVAVHSIVPNTTFPTTVTADNYPIIAAKLAFPSGVD